MTLPQLIREGITMTQQLSRHGRTAMRYWEIYRPRALQQLGDQEAFFRALDLNVTEQIGTLTDEMLSLMPPRQRPTARTATRAQATEIVYAERIWLPKEPGTEHLEM
ncbi:hypothetical protein [Nocardia vaccinii]|uniref:hypothetical protein n=1 Tax=Nocardia vaccinii TaxID=1822 RepID=UPI000A869928|nr:hypothetical protein [Nocardia vaccinii]